MLAALPPFDLSALELGMQRFLEQLGPPGYPLTGPWTGDGMWPWVVAGAAAAAACEIGRRQLRRAARGPDGEADPIPRLARDDYLAGGP